ncbi:MAG: hypothetical protein FK730_01275 [Asgard group archaeon]|nr:hypothetical protein [Asgard group archaeon]
MLSSSTIETKETRKERIQFNNHHPLTRIAFILSIITSLGSIIFGVVFSVTQKPGAIAFIVIMAIIGAMGLIGLIISGVSFRKGINVYNILGFIFSLMVINGHIVGIVLFVTSVMN